MAKSYSKANDLLCSHNVLGKLVQKASLIAKAQTIIDEYFAEDFAPYITVASIDNGVVNLLCQNAGIATQVRFKSPEIIAALKTHVEFAQVYNIQSKVRKKPKPKQRHFKPSSTVAVPQESKTRIRRLAEKTTDKKLAAALKNLAR